MAGRDPLFLIRNHFYLGSYQTVINEASDLEGVSLTEATERDVYLYRSYIAIGSHELVINEVSDSAPTAVQAVKLLAEYLSGRKAKDAVLATVQEWLADATCNKNPTVLLISGMIHAHEGNYVEALKCCHTSLTLDMMALSVQMYIKIDRPEKAEQTIKAMDTQDEDATLTQLAHAWLALAQGGAKIQEAQYIYQELGDKYNWTVPLLNGSAVCHMKMGQWDEADRELQEAFNKSPNDPDTLSNLITCGLHAGKNILRYSTQLKTVAPSHPFMKRTDIAEESFKRAAASFA